MVCKGFHVIVEPGSENGLCDTVVEFHFKGKSVFGCKSAGVIQPAVSNFCIEIVVGLFIGIIKSQFFQSVPASSIVIGDSVEFFPF